MYPICWVPLQYHSRSNLIFCTFLLLQAEEAMATYRTCIADAKTQKQELEDVKVNVLRQLQELIKQTDQILRSVQERCLLI